MKQISSNKFYKKHQLIACYPRNSVDSDGSSNSDEDEDGANVSIARKKKTVRSEGCLIADGTEENDDSDESECRWPSKGAYNDRVISETSNEDRSSSLSLSLETNVSSVQCSSSQPVPVPKQVKPSSIPVVSRKKANPSKKKFVRITDRFKPSAKSCNSSSLPSRPTILQTPSSRRKLFSPNTSIPEKKKRIESGRAQKLLDAARAVTAAKKNSSKGKAGTPEHLNNIHAGNVFRLNIFTGIQIVLLSIKLFFF